MVVCLGKIYMFRVFGCAAPSVPSFIGSKVILGCYILVCALTAVFLDGFPLNLVWWFILVKSARVGFLVLLPPVFRLLYGLLRVLGDALRIVWGNTNF